MPSCPICPICNSSIALTVQLLDTNTDNVTISSCSTPENTIRQALFGYWRWVAEGKPSPCAYYDHYHDCIEWLEEDRYLYHIQTFDSPEGDTWIRGTFRVQGVANIAVVEFSTEHV